MRSAFPINSRASCCVTLSVVGAVFQMRSLSAADADDFDLPSSSSSSSGSDSDDEVRYRELYSCCWHADRDRRPSAAQLVELLTRWSSAAHS